MFLCNAFSLQMLKDFPATVTFEEVAELPEGLTSAIGHQDTANVLGVPMNRVNVTLERAMYSSSLSSKADDYPKEVQRFRKVFRSGSSKEPSADPAGSKIYGSGLRKPGIKISVFSIHTYFFYLVHHFF